MYRLYNVMSDYRNYHDDTYYRHPLTRHCYNLGWCGSITATHCNTLQHTATHRFDSLLAVHIQIEILIEFEFLGHFANVPSTRIEEADMHISCIFEEALSKDPLQHACNMHTGIWNLEYVCNIHIPICILHAFWDMHVKCILEISTEYPVCILHAYPNMHVICMLEYGCYIHIPVSIFQYAYYMHIGTWIFYAYSSMHITCIFHAYSYSSMHITCM